MKLFGIEFIRSKKLEERMAASVEDWARQWMAGDAGDWTNWLNSQSIVGRDVNPSTAMRVMAVYACVRILTDTIGSLPLHVYRRLPGGGKEKAADHPLYNLLHSSPNPELTSLEFRDALQGHLALRGNAYAEIQRNNGGKIIALWPLNPDRVYPRRDKKTYKLYYIISTPSGNQIRLEETQILHIRGLSSDGIVGYSPITLAREAIGLAIAHEEYGARLYNNDAKPGGVLEHPGVLNDQAAKRLVESWNAAHQGLTNSHRVAILEEGIKWHQIGMTAQDAQFLESRRFQTEEIAQLFRIPPHMLANLKQPTFASVEQFAIDFVVHTIRPWLVRWEQRLSASLFDDKNYYPSFNVSGLLRGDTKSRYEAYSIGRQNGWLSADDIRELEDMNPLPEDQGKIYLVPLNMIPAQKLNDDSKNINDIARDAKEEYQRRVQDIFLGLFEDAARRIVKREIADIKRAHDKNNINAEWLADYYTNKFPSYSSINILPVYKSYAEFICNSRKLNTNADKILLEYTDKFNKSYSENSITEILNSDDINNLLVKWEKEKPSTVGLDELKNGWDVFERLGR